MVTLASSGATRQDSESRHPPAWSARRRAQLARRWSLLPRRPLSVLFPVRGQAPALHVGAIGRLGALSVILRSARGSAAAGSVGVLCFLVLLLQCCTRRLVRAYRLFLFRLGKISILLNQSVLLKAVHRYSLLYDMRSNAIIAVLEAIFLVFVGIGA
jgi:hypothetical protein